jgi:hypothetical protein
MKLSCCVIIHTLCLLYEGNSTIAYRKFIMAHENQSIYYNLFNCGYYSTYEKKSNQKVQ